MPLSESKILDRLNSRLPPRFKAIEVVELRQSGRNRVPYVRFYDTKLDKTFVYHANLAVRAILLNEDHPFKPDSCPIEKYQRLINDIIPGRYQVLGYSIKNGSGFRHYRLRVLDINRNVEFKYVGHTLVSVLRDDPEHIFAPSRTEHNNRSKAGAMAKYGVDHPMKDPEYVRSYIESKRRNGHIREYEGKTISEFAADVGCSYSWAAQALRENINLDNYGEMTDIESVVHSILSRTGLDFVREPLISGIKPDFLVPSCKLVIECDGLYWHSESNNKTKNHHASRVDILTRLGYKLLAFRADEISSKPNIIESIIRNSCGLSTRFYARKLDLGTVGRHFFETNHMMGCGTKKTGISLLHNGEPLMAMSFKRLPRQDNSWEIDRLCSRLDTIVVGGIGRILSKFVSDHNPAFIQSFVDRRFGTGNGLEKLGFIKKSESPSFKWTNSKQTFHRLRFPGNSGYECGFTKIWDYGQAKYVKTYY